ncbi:MAG: DUF1295 domain-containing protein [Steroidobacteraceae bacterium]|nr:DUF1295 domain-containing protein [Steroidobacteraceae bacterium]MDW8259371.1 DUF1295 domain-containing protein [Gammaproteobacteria bacterium]
MTLLESFGVALGVLLFAATAVWSLSVRLHNVAIVDILWGPMFLVAALCYAATQSGGPRTLIVLGLVAIWALRLAVYLTVRNWGAGEDRRYRAIRARNEPGFAWKSLYLIFGFQAALAALVSLPLLGAIAGEAPLGGFDAAGVALWAIGFYFEAVGDWQLARFKADPANRGKVMDRGLWRYTRHPNYFGDCCVWWGFYLLAVGAGAWWSLPGPVLMTVLLLRVSGVALLERDLGARRPGYADYIERTSAFFPWPPRRR